MDRLTQIRSFLKDIEADQVLLSDSVEIRYTTGLKSSNMALLISQSEAHLFTDFRYKEMAEQFCDNSEWIFHELSSNSKKPTDFIEANATVAVQSDQLSLDQFEQLESQCDPLVTFLRKGKEIASLFSIKNEQELESIAKAAKIADNALSQWLNELYTGISEREAADILEEYCRKGGSEGQSFDTIVLFGERAALPHGVPGYERTLKEGDCILVDFGCLINGYCSDMTRSFNYGEPNPAIKERYDITLLAQKAGVDAVRAGITAAEVDTIVRDMIVEKGYGEQFGHGTGHGVGLRIHESPALSSRDTTTLQEGMVVTVEPGIYVPGESGVRIEDLVVVTKTGCRTLSNSPKEFTIVTPVHRKSEKENF